MSSLKPLSPHEWDSLIDDYQNGALQHLEKWANLNYAGVSLLDLSLSSLTRKDFALSLKLNLIVFVEEYLQYCFQGEEVEASGALTRLLDSLRLIIQAPIDGVSVTFLLKEQFLISVTSTFVNCVIGYYGGLCRQFIKQLEGLIELLFTMINRPNHGVDRQTRAVACECLRELERACPSLLSEVAGNLWSLCQSERTHAAQSYVLLLAQVIHGVVVSGANVSILNSSMPLVPFNIPEFLINDGEFSKEFSDSNYKEFRRAMSFLLEWPHYLTSFGLLEFMTLIMTVAVALELQASLLKVQFSGLLYTFDPLLCHAFLGMYSQFLDAFDGQENEIANRLVLMSREAQHFLVFRLLALHWLLGFVGLVSSKDVGKKKTIVKLSLSFYPSVFDPLALKSLKLDLLSYSSILLDTDRSKVMMHVRDELGLDSSNVVSLFEDGLVSVSSFKWLPPWSTETAVAFRAFHKFLIGASSYYDTDSSSSKFPKESTIFHTIQSKLVEMALEFQGLVPVIVAFIDRFSACNKHRWLGERLLQTFDKSLIPKLKIEYRLGSYFPLCDRIAGNDSVPPGRSLELFAKFMIVLVEKHGPETGLKSWSLGSKIVGMCRTMLMHHHSSRLFVGLSQLLAFICLYFPDLEVRDSARIYLRMLICVPGQRLRHILNFGDQVSGISQSSHGSSFFSDQSPQISNDFKKSKNIASYIHLERVVPLLVKQSWSLSLSTLGFSNDKPIFVESIRDSELPEQTELNSQINPETERICQPQEPLRVMDSKVSEIVGILRLHFSFIPDYRHMTGLKIRIPCSLRFKSEPFTSTWGGNMTANGLNELDSLPAIYATVLSFSSAAPYGPLPSSHIPFLLGEPSRNDFPVGQTDSLAIISVENKSREEDRFKAPLMIELEPREPVPGTVDVYIETNADNGQIIRGQLRSITVGIEDMFLKAIIPEGIKRDAVSDYYFALFSAMWEACGTSASTGRETFSLKGGKGVTAVNGTRSVKLLEVPAHTVIEAVERHLAPYVVCIIGGPLVSIVKDGGVITDIFWKDVDSDSDVTTSGINRDSGPLYLKYTEDEDDRASCIHVNKKNMGCFLILIFLPPRFHLLFQMEVTDVSTLVRMRTDHWPCLAYIDDYLEALFFAPG